MAVAEKTMVERAPSNPQRELALNSLLGGLYVLISVGVIFSGLPYAWGELFAGVNEFLSDALLLIAEAVAIVGLVFLGLRLEKNSSPPRGFRAGTFGICVAAFVIVWITQWLGTLVARSMGPAAVVVPLAVAGGLIFVTVRLFLSPGFSRWLLSLEDQGWFHAVPYKGNQGVRVRRGTMLALLVLGGCGIWVMIQHRLLGSDYLGTGNSWEVSVPFTYDDLEETHYVVTLMHQVHYTVPLLLCVGLLWFSWRVVNWPMFTDFLIATEAEMNKVSWTSRKRLVQDTIVVLVTVALLTVFLFVVDIMWIQILRYVDVLRVDLRSEQLKQQESAKW